MSSNKIFSAFITFTLIFLMSCGDSNEEKNKAPLKDYRDPAVQLNEAKKLLGDNVEVTYVGNFNKDKKEELVAGLEINTIDEWGIKFTSIDIDGEKPAKIFETRLLDGSFEDSRIEKLNISSKDYELLYYSSGDFFMGTGGGEVFSYIIDFYEEEIYYAHLVADDKKISLFLSDNINNDDVRKFYLNSFKRDFPSYILVKEDVDYDE